MAPHKTNPIDDPLPSWLTMIILSRWDLVFQLVKDLLNIRHDSKLIRHLKNPTMEVII